MLFSYQYVPHSIESFQIWLDQLVKEVWCKATGNFSLDLLHQDLRAVVEEIYDTQESKTRGKTADWLFGPITKIYGVFQSQLTPAQRQQVSAWYDNNNDIEALCACDPGKLPATYADLQTINSDLANEMKSFCTSLWSNVLGLSPVQNRIGKIDAHYDALENGGAQAGKGKCPYCGYNDIKGSNYTRREAYDHFLPKSTYPFNSVNFRNLAPMCHECNSSYKLQKDPIRRADGSQRKAFYSYATASPAISISMILNTQDVTTLKPAEIDLQLTAPGHDEEVEAWREVFGIDERYKAKCCAENDGKAWLQHIIEECANPMNGLTSDGLLDINFRAAVRSPYDGANFLKSPFLQACVAAGFVR